MYFNKLLNKINETNIYYLLLIININCLFYIIILFKLNYYLIYLFIKFNYY